MRLERCMDAKARFFYAAAAAAARACLELSPSARGFAAPATTQQPTPYLLSER